MQIVLAKVAVRELEKISKGNAKQALMIRQFLGELALAKNPKNLPNGEKMQGYDDNRYRWRVGSYRVIGLVKDKELLIQIIKISSREGAYKGKNK